MTDDHKNSLQQLFDDFTMPTGCATVIATVIALVVLVVIVYGLWILFTTPSPPPAPEYDPSWGHGVPGLGAIAPWLWAGEAWLSR